MVTIDGGHMGRQQSKSGETETIGQIVCFAQDGEYFFNKGIKFYRHRDLYKAKKYFQRAVSFDPQEPVFLCQLAAVLAELGEFEESNLLLIQVVENLEPEMYECYYFLANNYAYLGLFHEAKKYAKLYLKYSPDGEFYEDTEDLLELLSIESNILHGTHESEDEDDLIIKQEYARKLLEDGKLEEASRELQILIKEYPEFWSAFNNLALAQFYLGNVNKAIKLSQDVLKKNTGNLHALCNLAVFYHFLGRRHEVDTLVKSLAVVYPIDMDHRSKLGVTYALIGKYEEAFKWLRWLQKYGYDGDAAFYYWLSVSAYYTNRKQLAYDAWQKVIKLNPEKKGAEPWLKVKTNDKNQTEKYSLIEQFKGSDNEEKKLLILLLLMRAGNVTSLQELQTYILSNKEAPYVQEFVNLMLNKLTNNNHEVSSTIGDGLQVIDTLAHHAHWSQAIEQKCYMLWFRVLLNGKKAETRFKNSEAWAAAIEYCCLRAEEFNVTQREIAEKYQISTSTLRKYMNLVTNLV
ncbi:tetratricopeptide repeat protein [Calidifontibacillus oryziterrae]|uniref:tetratricopeptide repeat protein n=1 Tax=Calidifontibacillus oryziterrae TaxID=1191699 RepID=UPI0003637EA8|nr:hypothetical protein [Calidifontibacillus oryziterrae]